MTTQERLERQKRYDKLYRLRHPERRALQQKSWRLRNPQKVKKFPSKSPSIAKFYKLRNKLKNPIRWAKLNREHSRRFRIKNLARAVELNRNSKLKRLSHYQRMAHNRHLRIWNNPHLRKRERARSVAWAKANPEKQKCRCMRYRARKSKVTVNESGILEFIKLVKSKPKTTCSYCNKAIATKGCHFDHITPISRGGFHELGNICVCCQSCNSSKGAKLLSEWKPKQNRKTPQI